MSEEKRKEWWNRIAKGRCPICLSKGPFKGGPIPVDVCECGGCKCEGCIDGRDRIMKGISPLPPITGGLITPPTKEEL